jgi:hypothetical protein
MSRYYRTTRAQETGTQVTTGHAEDMGLDVGEYNGVELTRWYNLCEEHSAIVGHQTLALAKRFASCPSEWCEECRDAVYRPEPQYRSDAPEWTI